MSTDDATTLNGSGDARRGGSRLEELLASCVAHDASDVHFSPGLPPYYRTHGDLEPSPGEGVITPTHMSAIVEEILEGVDRTPFDRTGSVDGALSSADGTRFRFNVFKRQGELAVSLRRLEDRFRTLAELGLPEPLYDLAELTDGLVVLVGPTGSGKSTTLATLLDRVNETRRCHIVTIEDPIEYVHKPRKALINQRQVGADTTSFNDALVASLRQDPDVILVGEIRDLNTIRTAITAAETGHLVFTTVHAGDCVGAIERLVSVFPADEQEGVRRQLSLVLRAAVTQRLLVADGKGPRPPKDEGRRRVVTSEVLFVNSAVANLIATGRSAQIYSTMEAGGSQGMQTMEQDLARLWVNNLISETAAVAVARNPGVMRDRAQKLRRRGAPSPGVAR